MVYDISIDDMLDNYRINRQGQYIISNENLYSLVEEYVVGEDYKDIKSYVSNYCVFKAIKLYEDIFGEFEINLDKKYEMYILLAQIIIIDIVKCSKMTENRDAENSDDEKTDTDTDDEGTDF